MDESSSVVILELPWPPSVNQYWRRNGNCYFISAKGVQFRKDVIFLSLSHRERFKKEDRLAMVIDAYPPDNRRRDLDNILKSILDSLQHGGIYDDDSQIDELLVRRNPSKSNKVIIKLTKMEFYHPEN